jgi:DNA-binding transcriptional regulator YhcF (GntR family)
MTISVHPGSAVPAREQIRYQIELQILGGVLRPGAALPSVRALARSLELSTRTVADAYRCLEATGRVVGRPGAGLFVASPPAATAADVEGACALALDDLVRQGHSRERLAAAARAWAGRPAASRVVVTDTTLAMAELIAAELQQGLRVPVVARALDDLVPSDEAGDLIATLPYHRAVVERRAPGTSVETIYLAPAPECERALRELPPDSLVLVLAHAPAVVPFARAVVHGLRGDELTLLSLERRERRRWAGAAHAAALVLADVLTFPEVEAAGLTNAVPLRLASPASVAAVAGFTLPAR